jgi:HK97 family phage major capsid protein
MTLEQILADIAALEAKVKQITTRAQSQRRKLSDEEARAIMAMQDCIDELKSAKPDRMVPPMLGGLGEYGAGLRVGGPVGLIPPTGRKDYRALFGNEGYEWPDKDSNFFSAIFSGRHHPGLIRAAMTEGVPSGGGFLVPIQTAEKIHAVSLESEIVQPRCYVQPMMTDTIHVPAMSIGDHSVALLGGFTAAYTAEAGTINENSPKARGMELNAKKLTGLIRFSAELNADTPGGMAQIETLCGQGLAWYRDKAFLKGTGAGQPLGILNAGCTVEVAKEGGQGAGTLIFENLTRMMSRMFAGSFKNSVWVCHQTTIPQLLTLSVAIGTGGSHIPVLQESNGEFKMLTRPVVFTEKTEPLGSKGDILLADFSQYVVGLRAGMSFETSIHVHFTTDELLSRIIERHDGQPLWDAPLTLADGATTVSPFVVLGAR